MEKHEVAHIAYSSWCVFCVKGKTINSPHMALIEDEDDAMEKVPRIAMGYWSVRQVDEDVAAFQFPDGYL